MALLEKRAAEVEKILAKYPPERKRSAVMPLLYLVQEEAGYCTEEGMREIAEICGMDPTEVKSVAGFYTMYFKHPVGKHVIEICDDLPCVLRGADKLLDYAEQSLGIKSGETTPDGLITLKPAMCLAACDRAPMCQVNLDYHYDLTPETFDAMVAQMRQGRKQT
jgi:NADH-quinone oxidoreductase subunit E